MAKEHYIKRHDRVCAQLHFNICKETVWKAGREHWYEHIPKFAETSPEGSNHIIESTSTN
jgi:hypothetical protein